MVYQHALRQITNPIMSSASARLWKPPPRRGALALLHINKHIRLESHNAMQHIVKDHVSTLDRAHKACAEEFLKVVNSTAPGPTLKPMSDDLGRASRRCECMCSVSYALSDAMSAHFGERLSQVQDEMSVAEYDSLVGATRRAKTLSN